MSLVTLKYRLLFATIVFLLSIKISRAQDHLPRPVPMQDTGQVIHFIHADILLGIQPSKKDSSQLQKLIGNVQLRQGQTIFSSDSAIQNFTTNTIDAFGHIHINQADTINTYSDFLHYEGNTKIATLKENVRMTDGKMVLTTDHLDYNMNTHIGNYKDGGRIVNENSILTSKYGDYYADTKDAYFKYDVKLTNPDYKLTTDTLLFNTETHIATFISPTAINTGGSIIYTSCGNYDSDKQISHLCNRPIIEDSTGTMRADSIYFDKFKAVGEAFNNVVWKDSSGQAMVQANYAISNNEKKTLLATRNPMFVLSKDKDTLFVTGDTLFSSPVLYEKELFSKKKKADSIDFVFIDPDNPVVKDYNLLSGIDQEQIKADSVNRLKQEVASLSRNLPFLNPKETSSPPRVPDSVPGSLKAAKKRTEDLKAFRMMASQLKIEPIGSFDKKDSVPITAFIPFDSSFLSHLERKITHVEDSLALSDSLLAQKAVKDTGQLRNLLVFHNVKFYSDSLQGVADSLYYSDLDSTFRLFKNPVLWTGKTQFLGDTILLVTKNQQADKMLLKKNALIVNQAGSDQFNQIKGANITGYFKDSSQIDWMNVEGNAESIYYAQEDSTGAFIGVNYATSASIKIFFKKNEVQNVVFLKDVSGTFKNPLRLKKEDKELKGFRWEDYRRPPVRPVFHIIKFD